MTIPVKLLSVAAFLTSVFILMAEAGLVPDGVVIGWIVGACLMIPGFTDEHEGWIEGGLRLRAALAVFGIRCKSAGDIESE